VRGVTQHVLECRARLRQRFAIEGLERDAAVDERSIGGEERLE